MSIVSFSKTYLGKTDLGDTYLGEFLPNRKFNNNSLSFLVEVEEKLGG